LQLTPSPPAPRFIRVDEEKDEREEKRGDDENEALLSPQSAYQRQRGNLPIDPEATTASFRTPEPNAPHARNFLDYLDFARELKTKLIDELGWDPESVNEEIAVKLEQLIPDMLLGVGGQVFRNRRGLLHQALVGAIDAADLTGVPIPELPPLQAHSWHRADGSIIVRNDSHIRSREFYFPQIHFEPRPRRNGAPPQPMQEKQGGLAHSVE
jgi:hypothetical protein